MMANSTEVIKLIDEMLPVAQIIEQNCAPIYSLKGNKRYDLEHPIANFDHHAGNHFIHFHSNLRKARELLKANPDNEKGWNKLTDACIILPVGDSYEKAVNRLLSACTDTPEIMGVSAENLTPIILALKSLKEALPRYKEMAWAMKPFLQKYYGVLWPIPSDRQKASMRLLILKAKQTAGEFYSAFETSINEIIETQAMIARWEETAAESFSLDECINIQLRDEPDYKAPLLYRQCKHALYKYMGLAGRINDSIKNFIEPEKQLTEEMHHSRAFGMHNRLSEASKVINETTQQFIEVAGQINQTLAPDKLVEADKEKAVSIIANIDKAVAHADVYNKICTRLASIKFEESALGREKTL